MKDKEETKGQDRLIVQKKILSSNIVTNLKDKLVYFSSEL